MTFVVTDNCIKCKYMDCVEVCPVDCFYEGENMLVIHPDECIDCGVCEPECPAEAILPDTKSNLENWVKLNADYALVWPNITIKRDPPADAKENDGVPGKRDRYFSQIPGEGTERQYCVNRLLQSQPRCRVMPHIALSDDDNRRTNRGEHIRRDPAFNMALGEQSAAAQSARVTRRLAALGEMTGGIAHDFRNILSIIESGLRLAETRLDEPEKVRIDIAAA